VKILHYSTPYKKDFKKYRNQPGKLQKLLEVLRMLETEEELPLELKAHKLTGQYKDCMECHIEGDFLLVWFDEDNDIIKLLRLGSHSELFKW
jgi:mRNA interferase YafQ